MKKQDWREVARQVMRHEREHAAVAEKLDGHVDWAVPGSEQTQLCVMRDGRVLASAPYDPSRDPMVQAQELLASLDQKKQFNLAVDYALNDECFHRPSFKRNRRR